MSRGLGDVYKRQVVADDPLSCVVRGCGIALEGIGKIEDSIFCFG